MIKASAQCYLIHSATVSVLSKERVSIANNMYDQTFFFCHFSVLFLLIGCFSLKCLSPGSVVTCSQEDVSVEPWKVIQGHLCREPVWTHCWNGGLC